MGLTFIVRLHYKYCEGRSGVWRSAGMTKGVIIYE